MSPPTFGEASHPLTPLLATGPACYETSRHLCCCHNPHMGGKQLGHHISASNKEKNHIHSSQMQPVPSHPIHSAARQVYPVVVLDRLVAGWLAAQNSAAPAFTFQAELALLSARAAQTPPYPRSRPNTIRRGGLSSEPTSLRLPYHSLS